MGRGQNGTDGENQDTERKACDSDILSTTNPTWNPEDQNC